MTRRRSPLSLLAAGALAAALVPGLGLGAGPVAAAPLGTQGAASLLADPVAVPVGRAWLEGLVVDQAGRPLDNVVVQAFDVAELADDPAAEPVSTWITYADPADGPAHGFYRLYVPQGSGATYEVRFSSPEGSLDPYRTRTLGRPHEVGGSADDQGFDEDLGTTVMSLERQAEARVALTPSRDVSRPGRPGRLVVTVTSPDVDPVTGRLALSVDGRAKAQQVLTRRADGRATFTVPALKPGKHTLAVRYAGSDLVEASSARTVVKVDQPGKGRGKDGKGGGRR